MPIEDLDDWEDNDLGAEKAAALRLSRRLDVHTWSDHPEVNQFVDSIYESHFSGGNERIRKRHLKVVLLDLYVAWWENPDLKISVSLNRNDYKRDSIYNELHISARTIDVVYRLHEVKLIEMAKGFFDRNRKKGFLTRIWPSNLLLEEFRRARFGYLDISYSAKRMPIVLRNDQGENIDFSLLPNAFREEIQQLKSYNHLLSRTFISIPDIGRGTIALDFDKHEYLFVSQARKFVNRVYNHSSFDLGGRFYGGWWQNCPKHLREKILINDQPTIEVDFSSIHPTLLYAQVGIDYWRDIGADPYAIDALSFQNEPSELRRLGKALLLILLNSNDRSVVPGALRFNAMNGDWIKSLKDVQVEEAIEALEAKHPDISTYFHTGSALELMRQDAEISAHILSRFLELNVPILLIHDSYIVEDSMGEILELAMQAAFTSVTETDFASKSKFVGQTYDDVMLELGARYDARQSRGSEQEEEEDLQLYRSKNPVRSDRYLKELREFRIWCREGESSSSFEKHNEQEQSLRMQGYVGKTKKTRKER